MVFSPICLDFDRGTGFSLYLFSPTSKKFQFSSRLYLSIKLPKWNIIQNPQLQLHTIWVTETSQMVKVIALFGSPELHTVTRSLHFDHPSSSESTRIYSYRQKDHVKLIKCITLIRNVVQWMLIKEKHSFILSFYADLPMAFWPQLVMIDPEISVW